MRIAALAFALLANGVAPAQTPAPGKPPDAKPADAKPAEQAQPYDPSLLRLSEILGALAYLGSLCGDEDSKAWRDSMAALMAAEATSEARKALYAGAFNKGYRGYELTYRSCTDNARLIIARHLEEGLRIARDVGGRYGGE